eukprot:805171-Amphidinium_carterae.1
MKTVISANAKWGVSKWVVRRGSNLSQKKKNGRKQKLRVRTTPHLTEPIGFSSNLGVCADFVSSGIGIGLQASGSVPLDDLVRLPTGTVISLMIPLCV